MAGSLDALRDTRREWMINRSRLIASVLAITVVLGVLVYRYYSLQIVQHDGFMTQSDRNRIRVEVIPPTRGQIVDRKGRLLAANKPTFVIGVVRERSEDPAALVETLAERLSLTDRELKAFQERTERRRPFEAVPIKLGLDDAALAWIRELQPRAGPKTAAGPAPGNKTAEHGGKRILKHRAVDILS